MWNFWGSDAVMLGTGVEHLVSVVVLLSVVLVVLLKKSC